MNLDKTINTFKINEHLKDFNLRLDNKFKNNSQNLELSTKDNLFDQTDEKYLNT